MNHFIEFRAMSCRMIAILDCPSAARPPILDQVPTWFEEWEQSLSRFREQSELSFVNRSSGWPVRVSQTFWDVFQAALWAEQESDGLVTPAVLEALVAAGYNRSFDQLPREQDLQVFDGWKGGCSLREVTLDEETRSLCTPLDMQLDFGGVAKGWAAHQAMQRLAKFGPALVSAGGDVAISAEQLDGQRWPILIDNPFEKGSSLGELRVGTAGVATSGRDLRRWKQGKRWSHHIIDPRTGNPAQTDIFTATVIAPTVMEAEMASKTILILGSEQGLAWIEARPQLAAQIVLESGQILYSRKIQQFLWRSL